MANELQLLHFVSAGRHYAVNLSIVKEVLRMVQMTRVTELPSFVTGMINLRGDTVPVIDFMTRARAGDSTVSLNNRILIMAIKNIVLGLLVDEVREVINVDASSVSKNIQSEIVIDSKYIYGTFLHRSDLLIWVDVEKLLTSGELTELEQGLESV